jgi:putative ABC transport system permease protein
MIMPDKRYKWLLRLLPASFREDHETEILRVWRDEHRDASAEGRRTDWRPTLVADGSGTELQARTTFAPAYPGGDWGFSIASFKDEVLAGARVPLYLLLGLVSLVLVMACANVANLLLIRVDSRTSGSASLLPRSQQRIDTRCAQSRPDAVRRRNRRR